MLKMQVVLGKLSLTFVSENALQPAETMLVKGLMKAFCNARNWVTCDSRWAISPSKEEFVLSADDAALLDEVHAQAAPVGTSPCNIALKTCEIRSQKSDWNLFNLTEVKLVSVWSEFWGARSGVGHVTSGQRLSVRLRSVQTPVAFDLEGECSMKHENCALSIH
jgi:hypothetical protein